MTGPVPVESAALVAAFNKAMRSFDLETATHMQRVGHLARGLGATIGMSDDDLDTLGLAGMLHDIGKLGISQGVLQKNGPLGAEEWDLVKRHSAVGANMLLALSSEYAPAAAAVRSHHERWDGSGYPDGLAGEDVPLTGRVLAIADVYDTLTNTRPYRSRVATHEEALVFVAERAGTAFDPQVVIALLDATRPPDWSVIDVIKDLRRQSSAHLPRTSQVVC